MQGPAECSPSSSSTPRSGVRPARPAGPTSRAACAALDAALGGRLHVRYGDPRTVVAEVGASVRADSVHVSADFGPYGVRRATPRSRRRWRATDAGWSARARRTRSHRAGSARTTGRPTASSRRSTAPGPSTGGAAPAGRPPADLHWLHLAGGRQRLLLPDDPGDPVSASVPPAAGEAAALLRWHGSATAPSPTTPTHRDRPDLAGTSALSAALRWGEIHPRTLLADLATTGRGHETFRKELAWREFYADVLHHDPGSARLSLRPALAGIAYDHGPVADAALRGLVRRPHRLPVRRRRHAAAAAPRAGCTTGCGWWSPRSWSRTCTWTGAAARGGSCSSLRRRRPRLQPARLAVGGRDRAPMPRRTSGSSTRSRQGLTLRPGRRLRPPVRARARRPGGPAGARAVERRPDGCPRGYPERIVDHAEERGDRPADGTPT